MLIEIYCDKFKQQTVTFNEGLSVVLGTEIADNSIGKSTFLMIVDYAFGGKTYANSKDIIENVGEHYLYFTFRFNNQIYKFCRHSIKIDEIWECDNNYKKIKKIDSKQYNNWLNEKYDILLPDLSFRDAVGRYIRVYSKNNCNEKYPLQYKVGEKPESAILALLKLFNLYVQIKSFKEADLESKENLSIYKKAQNLDYVENITKVDFTRNKRRILQITDEIEKLSKNIENGLFDIDIVASEEAIETKRLLSKNKRIRNKILANYKTINENAQYQFSITTDNINALKKYFPNVDINSINEIENFHNKISEIFKSELQEQKDKLKSELSEYDKTINELEEKLKKLINNPNLSRLILSKHAELLREKEYLQKQNNSYEKLQDLKNLEKENSERLKNIKNTIYSELQFKINEEMKKINNKIYGDTCNSPILHFTEKNYNFYTPNDTGTGIACKGLVVFDLSILNLTKLPLLVHDSVFLKQITDNAIEHILRFYIESNKQIIIALDKQTSYTLEANKILNEYSVLKLGINQNALFGKEWG